MIGSGKMGDQERIVFNYIIEWYKDNNKCRDVLLCLNDLANQKWFKNIYQRLTPRSLDTIIYLALTEVRSNHYYEYE